MKTHRAQRDEYTSHRVGLISKKIDRYISAKNRQLAKERFNILYYILNLRPFLISDTFLTMFQHQRLQGYLWDTNFEKIRIQFLVDLQPHQPYLFADYLIQLQDLNMFSLKLQLHLGKILLYHFNIIQYFLNFIACVSYKFIASSAPSRAFLKFSQFTYSCCIFWYFNMHFR